MHGKREKGSFSLKSLWQAINRPRVGPILHVRFFYGLAFAIFQTIFPHPNTHTNSDSNNQHDSDMESLPISQSEIDALEDVDPADLMIF